MTEANDEADFYSAMASATPVSLLMTRTKDLLTCSPSECSADVVARRSLADFDDIPVKLDGHIVGLFDRLKSSGSGSIADEVRPLSARILIGDRTSIFDFIDRADKERCRIVIGARGIVGMITASDLQKLPVQVALFGLAALFEHLVSEHLQRTLGDKEERYISVLDHLDERVVKNAKSIHRRKEARNLTIDWIGPLSLGEKLLALQAVNPSLMDWERAAQIRELRNDVAHPHPFAQTEDLVRKLVSSKRALVDLTRHLRRALRKRSDK